jgi:hypothetical protein
LAVNRRESPELHPGHRGVCDRYVHRAGAVMRPRFDGNPPRMSLILRAMLRRCRAAPRPIHFFEVSTRWAHHTRPPT